MTVIKSVQSNVLAVGGLVVKELLLYSEVCWFESQDNQ